MFNQKLLELYTSDFDKAHRLHPLQKTFNRGQLWDILGCYLSEIWTKFAIHINENDTHY
jgi:hypothetical protein